MTDQDGFYFIGPLPAGDYTLTPAAPVASSATPSLAQLSIAATSPLISEEDFLVTPQWQPGAVAVSGDPASGVSTQTLQTVVPIGPEALNPLSPSLVIYDPATDRWTFSMDYDPSGHNGTAGGVLGGEIVFVGRPAPGTYGPPQEPAVPPDAFGECWASGPFVGVGWYRQSYTLTLSSVGTGQPASVPLFGGNVSRVYYPVHGTAHVDCTGASPSISATPPPGTVSIDVTF